ncbi:molybdopterin-containing oxidoreductase family protein [Rhizobium rhizogenes]|uniref:molybdopterin-containing oxidoreductase family protein n=1 Tax=Rhizobium rhizogenes TaxID=359 RepID=UPI00157466CD|nr:molybdopterin-dependent oxidoreductase [Rhizobium rhizogenes]NTH22956.1 molybdopterin-dependent oxidoreductase [Rhizobium rhizogenes]NTH35986.1 molybdopterin-dependent oxidoreductase [Rhizobium rhizogenes]
MTSERKIVRGACPQDCPDTCAFLYTVEDGKLLSVRGDPEHPVTQGRLCTKLNDFAAHHYNPDRILYPMRRVGAKGAGQFERITWSEALAEIKSRWSGIIDEFGSQAILPCSYLGHEGVLNGLTVGDAFFNRMGSSIAEKTFCGPGREVATHLTYGPTTGVDPESLVHSRYIILWAVNTLSTGNHHWPFITEARDRGAKIVVIDPLRTKTAAQADWHIPIRPGTDAALALGMMNIIISEGLLDRDYVEKYTVGFEELAERASAFQPETVAEITGISVPDLLQLSREYAASQSSVIRVGVAIERNRNGGQAARAISCLPALVGAWRHVGGGYLTVTMGAFPINWNAMSRPDWIKEGTRVFNLNSIGAVLLEASDPPIKSLMVYNINPVVQAPDQDKIRQGLSREDLFVVVSDLFVTDTARYADILLPATMQAEQTDLMFSWGHFYWTYNTKAIEAPGEAVPNTQLFRMLAETMGFDEPEWKRSDEDMIRDFVDWNSPFMEGITLDALKENGYMKLAVGDKDQRVPHAEGNFPTPSGKCEFKSSAAEHGNFVPPPFRAGYEAFQDGGYIDPVPVYLAPFESPASSPALATKYPLNIISPKAHSFLNSQYANEMKQRRREGGPVVVMHPEDAQLRDLVNGDSVRVFNDRGSFTGSVHVSSDTLKGVVASFLGHWVFDAKSKSAVNSISSSRVTNIGRAPTYNDNLVEVTKTSDDAISLTAG